MKILKALFGNSEETPEEEKKNADARKFDLMKYDGVKAMKIGRFDYAVKCFEEALQLHDDLEVRDYLSRSLVQQGQYDEALQQLALLIEAQPHNVSLPMQAAHVAFLKEDYDQMQAFCEQALSIDGQNARIHYTYARACLGKKDVITAIARLTQSITLDDSYADAYLLRGQTLLALGDTAGAEADATWLMDHAANHEDVLLFAARVQRAKGNVELAQRIYDAVVEVNPFQIDAYRERGQLRYEQGDKKGAQEDMQKVLELNPQEMADVSGDYSAEGIEHKVKQAYSALNPFGL